MIALFQQTLHLFRIIPKDKIASNLYDGCSKVSGLVDDHGGGYTSRKIPKYHCIKSPMTYAYR